MIRKITFNIFVFGLLVSIIPVMGAPGLTVRNTRSDSVQIKEMLQNRDKEIKDLVGPKGTTYTQKQKDKLKDIINDIVDYGAMAKVALQKTYDTLSTSQRKEFVDTFSQVIRDQSLNKLDIYRAKITYKKIDVTGDSAYVKTVAELQNVRTPVSYTMERKSGKWYITDFIIDNVSTAKSYQRTFQNYLAKKGYESLLAVLKKRISRS
ncbi:MAG TPA: ABC transporter substrate-binding protein [Balneolales bacterium]|nr:ABC transporter substrate-binding protein [Balneolales bacterium]